MFIYILIIVAILAFSLVEILVDGEISMKLNLIKFNLCFMPILLLVILRGTGFDFDAYYFSFETLHFASFSDVFDDIQFEPGFILLNILSPSFISLIVIIGIATLVIKYRFIHKISPYPAISILILMLAYILNFEMGQMRQALSMSLTLYASLYYQDKWKMLPFIVLAVLFHYSAMIFILALLITPVIREWYFYIIVLLVAIVFNFIAEPLIILASDYLPGFSGAKLLLYYEKEHGEGEISIPFLLLKTLLIVAYYIQRKSSKLEDKQLYDYIFNLYYISLVIYLAFAFFPQISGRGSAYFGIFEIVLIPILLKSIHSLYIRLSGLLVYIIVYLYIFISFLHQWGESFIPYKTWLFQSL